MQLLAGNSPSWSTAHLSSANAKRIFVLPAFRPHVIGMDRPDAIASLNALDGEIAAARVDRQSLPGHSRHLQHRPHVPIDTADEYVYIVSQCQGGCWRVSLLPGCERRYRKREIEYQPHQRFIVEGMAGFWSPRDAPCPQQAPGHSDSCAPVGLDWRLFINGICWNGLSI